MKTKALILSLFILSTAAFYLHAQEPIPDTVWTKTFLSPIYINCVKFSPDGQYIFAGTNNAILQIETATGNIFRTLQGHKDKVYTIDFSPTGDTILSSSFDKTIRMWNYNTGDSIDYFSPDSFGVMLSSIEKGF